MKEKPKKPTKFYKGFKFRLYPTKEQEAEFRQHCGNTRFLWNKILSANDKHYAKTQKFYFRFDVQKKLPMLKKKYPFLAKSYSQSLQCVCQHYDRALKDYLKSKKDPTLPKKEFPKPKKRGSHDSFTCPQKWHYNKGSIFIPKIGNIRWVKHRAMVGKPISITVSRDVDQWYVSVLCEIPIVEKLEIPIEEIKTDLVIGLDVGVARLGTTSDNHFHSPIKLEKEQRKVKTLQREMDRRKKKVKKPGIEPKVRSSNYKKSLLKLQKASRKLRRRRSDKLHKYSRKIVYRTKAIFAEDLKIKNMTHSAKGTVANPGKNVKAKSGLNREILNQSWGILYSFIEYKARFEGKMFEKVNPRNTSRKCNICGFTKKGNRVSQSEFKCLKCGHEDNADLNAACNIRNLGIQTFLKAA